LNVCGRTPLVLAFFAVGSGDCERQVDTMQTISRDFRAGSVQFAAIAVRAKGPQTASLVRSHHWTIPVAYDRDGAVGTLYGVAVCPIVELAYRGGVVAQRLIGDHWLTAPALAARVTAMLAHR
jgi:peroxiredoxin